MNWFRRTRPAPELTEAEKAAISADYRARVHEIKIMSAHGFTPAGWDALTDPERAHYRATYTQAERFAA